MGNFSNTARTMYLTSSITNTSTSVAVTNTPGGSVTDPAGYGWPTVPFFAEIDGDSTTPEVVKVTNNASGTLTIQRATGQTWAYGSVAYSHTMNAPIVPVLSAADISSVSNEYVQSRGGNMVTNGTGFLLDDTNFSDATFDAYHAKSGSGAFVFTTYNSSLFTDEYLAVNTEQTYKMQWSLKQTNSTVGAKAYGGVACYDIDRQLIQAYQVMFQPNTHTTLAQDLKPGDTTVYLSSAANWNNSAGGNQQYRNIIVWGYANSFGYVYPNYTYSRRVVLNAYADGGINYGNNTVTLSSPWPSTWGTISAGTAISNGNSGGTYQYIAGADVTATTSWQTFTGEIGLVDLSGTVATNRFRPGTAFVKLLWLLNRDVSGSAMAIADISFSEISSGSTRNFIKYDTTLSGINWLTVKRDGATSALSVDVTNNRIGVNKDSPAYTLDIAGTANITGATIFGSTVTLGSAPSSAMHAATKQYVDDSFSNSQPLDSDLTSIAGLAGTTGFLKKTGAGTWSLATTIPAEQIEGTITNVTIVGTASGNAPLEATNKDDITTRTQSGAWQTSTATVAEGWPETTNTWYHLLTSTHSNTGNYYSMQFAGNFFNSAKLFYRATNNNGSSTWYRVWHQGNDGHGSGLDADTVDGIEGSSLALLANPTFLGTAATDHSVKIRNVVTQNSFLAIQRPVGSMSAGMQLGDTAGKIEAVVTVNNNGLGISYRSDGTNTSSGITLYSGDTLGSNVGTTDIGIRAKLIEMQATKVQLKTVGTTGGLELGSSGPVIQAGSGVPSHAAPLGSTWRNTSTGVDFIKRGTGNSDWAPIARVTVASTPPGSPVNGDLWVDTSTPVWTTLSYSNSWVSYDNGSVHPTAGYLLDAMGFVNFRGGIKSGTVAVTAFTLPTGYRPTHRLEFIVFAYGTGQGYAIVQVNSNGTVVVTGYGSNGGNGLVSLSGIRFATF